MPAFQFYREQVINAEIDELWDFISRPENLSKITPPQMGFKITTKHLSEVMYEGQIITYTVKPMFGIPVQWVTEITKVKDKEYFVDEQRSGPYSIWHHEHRLMETDEGILMTDLITYKPPLGFLGTLANQLIIKRKLNQIFNYRKKVLDEVFGNQINK